MAGVHLFDGRSAVSQAVSAGVRNGQLEITDAEGTPVASWPLPTLVRTDADAPGEGATLRRRGGAERLVVSDAALLRDLRAHGMRLGPGIDGPGRRWTLRTWAGWTAGLLASVAAVVLLVDRLPSLLVPFVPASIEHGWSEAIQATVAAGAPRCAGAAGQAALTGLVGRLSEAAGLAPPPELTVLDSKMVNASTLPDGLILVMRGMIAGAGDGDALAGVVAHEMGHTLHHDPTRESVRRLAYNLVGQSLGWGGAMAGQVTALSYGRQAEAAADASALETLRRAGLRADGLGRLFEHMEHADGDLLPAFLSDHPSSASRAALAHVEPVGRPAFSDAEWAAIQGMCGRG